MLNRWHAFFWLKQLFNFVLDNFTWWNTLFSDANKFKYNQFYRENRVYSIDHEIKFLNDEISVSTCFITANIYDIPTDVSLMTRTRDQLHAVHITFAENWKADCKHKHMISIRV